MEKREKISDMTSIKNLMLVLIFISGVLPVLGQLDKTSQKKLNKVEKLYKKKKYLKSGMLMKDVINTYPVNQKLWDMYEQIMYKNYVSNPLANRKVSVNIDGEQTDETRRIQQQLMYVMHKPKYDYYDALYYAAMCVPYNMQSSYTLRSIYIDERYFNLADCSDTSLALFAKAEKEFRAKNYKEAIALYTQSYSADSTNYKALMYLGDSYFGMEYYGKAISYFKKARDLQPYLNEPVKFLADAYFEQRNYDKAMEYALQGLLLYPEESILNHINAILERMGGAQKLDRNWVLRLSPVNSNDPLLIRSDFFSTKLHFEHYTKALAEVKDSYDAKGIRKKDADTRLDTYLEVESWIRMLAATENEDIPALAYAQMMKKRGLLAPYIFINLFSVDLYDQYFHYVATHREEATDFIKDYLILAK